MTEINRDNPYRDYLYCPRCDSDNVNYSTKESDEVEPLMYCDDCCSNFLFSEMILLEISTTTGDRD
jgi:hypothetical protein